MGPVNGATIIDDDDKSLTELLPLPILLIDRIRNSAKEAQSSKSDCLDIVNQVDNLSHKLGAVVRLATATATATPSLSLYDRPVRRIVSDVSRNLDRALTLVRRCRHRGFLNQVIFSISTSADFKKVSALLDASIGDMKWLLAIFDCEGNNLTLPPFAIGNEPTLAMVWSSIASLIMAKRVTDRIDCVNYLTLLADSNDRNKKMIVEEGAVPPLLKLLKDQASAEAQIAAANALESLSDDVERTRAIAAKLGIPVIVQALGNSPMKVQIAVAELVARMAEVDAKAREDFGRENVMRPIVSSCLMMDLVLDDYRQINGGKTSIHSIVQDQISMGLVKHNHSNNKVHSSSSSSSLDGSRGNKKDIHDECPEIKHELKVKCALALWRLCKGSLLNSRKIAEGRGLQCLSKIIETEKGELQLYSLLTVMEIAEVAEIKDDFRKAAWKPSSPSVKGILDQLLRVIKEETDPDVKIPAIKAIGYLARTFSAKETRIIGTIVAQLGNKNINVAIEAVVALGKFVCPENYNCVEHSKTIILFNGMSLLMKMLRSNDETKIHGLVLLCYLSLSAGNNKVLMEARTLDYLESSAVRSVLVSIPGLRDMYFRAVHHLKLYQVGARPHAHIFSMV